MPDDPPPSPRPAPPPTVNLPAGAAHAGEAAVAAGQAFGDYELLGEIERGGMGVVYRARERHSGRLVALKMMLGESASSPADLSRFVLEAQTTAELQHPGVVAIHAWGLHDGHPFYTMDFVPGRPLHRLLADGPLPVERAVRYLLGVAEALAAAHALGIVHRDLKPSNVMIDAADQPRVLDFGLAKRRRPAPLGPGLDEDLPFAIPAINPSPPTPLPNGERGANNSPLSPKGRGAASSPLSPLGRGVGGEGPTPSAPLTEKGAILGTPSYMAPEQVRAEHDRVGPPADVHALGAIFYEMLTGRPPYQGASTYATLMQVLDGEPAPVRSLRPEVPPPLGACIARCLAKEPHERYPSAGVLADELERRWRRWAHAKRFARLTLFAAAALVALQLVQPFLVGHPSGDHRGFVGLVETVTGEGHPLRAAAAVLDALVHVLATVGGPTVGGLGLLTWSAAWVWYTTRPRLLCRLWLLPALAGLAAWSLAWRSDWPWGSVFLPGLLLANAVGVYGAALARRHVARRRLGDSATPGDSYLQKLFAARGATPPRESALAEGGAVAIADFELGKRVHDWDGGAVHRARQKSLDRAVLVWRDSRPSEDAPPGVVVRHPCVLGLHAVSSTEEGRLLVTDSVAASPLAEVLRQRPLSAREAVVLTARLADVVQAFHDQGACHGRLRPEWLLVRGDLEPVLCPCGVPSESAGGRADDVRALGKLLYEWLPPRPWSWRYEALAPVYRVCDAARQGQYARAVDLAKELRRAVRAGEVHWRGRCLLGGVFVLLLLPWLGVKTPGFLAVALLGLCPAALLSGYTHVRSTVQRFRLRGSGPDRLFPAGRRRGVAKVALVASLCAALGAAALAGDGLAATLPRLLGVLLGFAFVGGCLAGGVTFAEVLARTLRGDEGGAV